MHACMNKFFSLSLGQIPTGEVAGSYVSISVGVWKIAEYSHSDRLIQLHSHQHREVFGLPRALFDSSTAQCWYLFYACVAVPHCKLNTIFLVNSGVAHLFKCWLCSSLKWRCFSSHRWALRVLGCRPSLVVGGVYSSRYLCRSEDNFQGAFLSFHPRWGRPSLTASSVLNTPSSLAWIPPGNSPLCVSHLTPRGVGNHQCTQSHPTLVFFFFKYAFWGYLSGHQVCPVFLPMESPHPSLTQLFLPIYDLGRCRKSLSWEADHF